MDNTQEYITEAKQMVKDYINTHHEETFTKTITASLEKAAIVIVRKLRNLNKACEMINENNISLSMMVNEGICSKSCIYHKKDNHLGNFVREISKKSNLICLNDASFIETTNRSQRELEHLRSLKDELAKKEAYILLLEKELKRKDPDNGLLKDGRTLDDVTANTRRIIDSAKANAIIEINESEITAE